MNCAGHCNFECFPRWAQWGPLKYYVYTSCYHSLHHSKYKWNYCLFCPIWDHLCGTAHPTSQALHREVTDRARRRRPTDVVFLAHGHDVPSMVTHVPFVSPFLCSVTHATGWVATLLWPLCYVWARPAQLLLPATVMQRYRYRGTEAATWCLPIAARGLLFFVCFTRLALPVPPAVLAVPFRDLLAVPVLLALLSLPCSHRPPCVPYLPELPRFACFAMRASCAARPDL